MLQEIYRQTRWQRSTTFSIMVFGRTSIQHNIRGWRAKRNLKQYKTLNPADIQFFKLKLHTSLSLFPMLLSYWIGAKTTSFSIISTATTTGQMSVLHVHPCAITAFVDAVLKELQQHLLLYYNSYLWQQMSFIPVQQLSQHHLCWCNSHVCQCHLSGSIPFINVIHSDASTVCQCLSHNLKQYN